MKEASPAFASSIEAVSYTWHNVAGKLDGGSYFIREAFEQFDVGSMSRLSCISNLPAV
jgi:hypothetical protein